MSELIEISSFKVALSRNESSRICYVILPGGLEGDIVEVIDSCAEKYSCNIAVLTGNDWNNDLTPWPAEGVFKKAKPFGGNAAEFTEKLKSTILPEVESNIGLGVPERALIGVSLSGLYSLWAGVNYDLFKAIGCISGSFWYDDLVDRIKQAKLSPTLSKCYLTLGDREKNSKNQRMAVVEDCTRIIYEYLKDCGVEIKFDIFDGTHFSPILPRFINTLEYIYE